MVYGELWLAVKKLSDAYLRLGVGHNDRIMCSMSNRPEYLAALGAAWMCGAVHVGVDYQSTVPELSRLVEQTQAKALIYEPADGSSDPLPAIQTLRKNLPDIRIILVGDRGLPDGLLTLSDLMHFSDDSHDKVYSDEITPNDPAIIFISSGTTGTPKASVGYHGNLGQRWQRLATGLGFGPDDVHLAQLPLSHGFGMMMAVAAIFTGGRLVFLNHFSADKVLRAIGTERVTVLNGAPAHFRLLLGSFDPKDYDVRSLRLSVGTTSIFPPSLVRAIWDRLGVSFMYMYGASEGVGVATTDREDILQGSVGRPAVGSVTIVGSDHQPVPLGEIGEIAFSKKVFPVQYWGSPSAESKTSDPDTEGGTAISPASDWYYSGDLGRLDEQGRLYVIGRLTHQIDRGGLKVDPLEVEGALLRLPEVSDAAVIGVPNPVLGETVCACVVAAPRVSLELAQLRGLLGRELAPYKLPEELYLLAQIPRTHIGKVDLPKLRAEVEAATQQFTLR